MFALIRPYIIGGIAFLVAALVASNIYFINATSDATTAANGYKGDLSALQIKVAARDKQEAEDRANQAQLRLQNEHNGQKFLDSKRSVEGFKGREAVLRAKPGLTESLINKSFANFADEISCATGDSKPCK